MSPIEAPYARALLPGDIARCRPSCPCPVQTRCARSLAPMVRTSRHSWSTAVDASVCLQAGPCPMFMDAGGLTFNDIQEPAHA